MGNIEEERTQRVGEALNRLYQIKLKIEYATTVLDQTKDEYSLAEEIALKLMIDANLLTASTELANFKVEKTEKFWVLAENKESFISWAKVNAPFLIKEDYHYKTLNSWANEAVRKGLEIPPTLKSGPVVELSVRKKRT